MTDGIEREAALCARILLIRSISTVCPETLRAVAVLGLRNCKRRKREFENDYQTCRYWIKIINAGEVLFNAIKLLLLCHFTF